MLTNFYVTVIELILYGQLGVSYLEQVYHWQILYTEVKFVNNNLLSVLLGGFL